MKKLLTLALITALALSLLSACGKGNDDTPTSAGSTSMMPAQSSGSTFPSGSNTSPSPSANVPATSQPSQSEDPSTTPSSVQNSVSGILLIDVGVYNNRIIRIYSVDPKTGSSREIRRFDLRVGNYELSMLYETMFDSEYERMAIDIENPGLVQSHAGWIDIDGAVQNVTELLMEPPGDFSPPVAYRNGKFGADGYFYFEESKGFRKSDFGLSASWRSGYITVMRVPIHDLKQESIEVVCEADGYQNISYDVPLFDGSLVEYAGNNLEFGRPRVNSSFSDSTKLYRGTNIDPIRWIDATRYTRSASRVGIDIIDVSDDTPVTTEIVPYIDGMTSWNPVVSPDRTTIAFNHRNIASTMGLFTVPVIGGEPIRIPYDYGDKALHILDWR